MASLNRIALDVDLMHEGKWVPVKIGEELLEVRARGFIPKWRDTLHRLRLEKVKEINRGRSPGEEAVSVPTLAPTVDDVCAARALADECFIDVRGLNHYDNGPAVTADEFKALLLDPVKYRFLLEGLQSAVGEVTADRSRLIETATGN